MDIILPESFYTDDLPFFDRLTKNHYNEIKRNHLSIIYFMIKQDILKKYSMFFYAFKNNIKAKWGPKSKTQF